MLCANVIVVEARGLFIGEFKNFFNFSREGRIAIHLDLGTKSDEAFNFPANGVVIEVEIAQDMDGDALAELKKAEEDVFCAKIIVVEALGLFLGQLDDLFGAIGEFVEHIPSSRGNPSL